MVARESKEVIYAAIVANLAIAICKYVAAALTHRSTMLAEAIHSTADTGNELLLLVGMKRSTRPPDELHPHGHGKALYFYSLLVAVYIFGVRGGLQFITESPTCGIRKSPIIPDGTMRCSALAAAFEFYSLRVSKLRGRAEPLRRTFHHSALGASFPQRGPRFIGHSGENVSFGRPAERK